MSAMGRATRVALGLLQVAALSRCVFGADTLACEATGSEDWPAVHRQLLRLLDGQVGANVLGAELDRVSESLRAAQKESDQNNQSNEHLDCLPGRISLDLLLLLTHPGPFDGIWNEEGLLDLNWRRFPWPTVVRSGWPVFRLLRLLQKRAQAQAEAAAVPGCEDTEDSFEATLLKHVRHQKVHEAILGASVGFLLNPSDRCPLSTAAAYLASAWVRFPVYDEETEDILGLAEESVRNLSLASILVTDHGLLAMLDDVAGSYQAFLIDSGALYVDMRQQEDENVVDYTRHMMSAASRAHEDEKQCELQAQTPLGRCNGFAALGSALSPWRSRGVAQEDTVRALQATEKDGSPQALLFRLVEHDATSAELRLLTTDEVMRDFEPLVECLAQILVPILAAMLDMPRLEFVVALEEMKKPQAPLLAGRRQDVPPPLFCFCQGQKRGAFKGIPLPALCPEFRPTCTHKEEAMSEEEQLCYIFRLLSGFSELLRYVPPGHAAEEQAWTLDDLSVTAGVSVKRAWPVVGGDPALEESVLHCAKLIDTSAA
ncbi:unnamed protein product [Durusdinium trenchii]|uniref:Uncharacterized protein n=2 Tax=Durusdinium trenchii TaxID=1381693 RepID=A0ABP0I6J3_9DINO